MVAKSGIVLFSGVSVNMTNNGNQVHEQQQQQQQGVGQTKVMGNTR